MKGKKIISKNKNIHIKNPYENNKPNEFISEPNNEEKVHQYVEGLPDGKDFCTYYDLFIDGADISSE